MIKTVVCTKSHHHSDLNTKLMIECKKNDYGINYEYFRIGNTKFTHFDLLFVHSGQFKITVSKKNVELNSGDAILIFPDTPFYGIGNGLKIKISVHHFFLKEEYHLPETIKPLRGKKNGFIKYTPHETAILENCIEQVITLTHEKNIKEHEDERSLIMMQIISRLQVLAKSTQPRTTVTSEIKQLLRWLERNIDKDISLDTMAKQAGLSTSNFRLQFKRQMNISPGSYLLTLRAKEAARLLRRTPTPIKEIASLTGYKDLPHFYHAFKKSYKTTPKTYRDYHTVKG